METPVFEEFDPASDCGCPGCLHWRRALPLSRTGHHPAAHRAVIVAAAASAALGAGHAVPALAAPHAPPAPGVPAADTGDEPSTPQGGKAPLHGPAGKPAKPPHVVKAPVTTRAEIIRRAKIWVAAQVPYSMDEYWSDGYRQDCSGFVSMAWNLPGNEWTGSLDQYGQRISKEELQPGDILLFHNPSNPENGSHVVIFGGWADYTHSYYIAYEETRPHARRQATPYAYWSHSDRYLAFRYKGLAADTAGGGTGVGTGTGVDVGVGAGTGKDATAYPGAVYFGPGANNKYVTRLGQMLVARGAARFYTSGPGPRWSDADRRATQAFQLAQGWRGADADGLPGPQTWALLVSGTGKDIATAGTTGTTGATGAVGAAGPPATSANGKPGSSGKPASHGVPGYPGRGMFRPGANNDYVIRLGKQLVKKGFGKYYTTGPGPRWGEADRRNVEAFQRAQGWRGGAADGYPGPETWRRLFS
ncbi:peptidoglycan-binding protein [Streptomyces cylindrosporus]|uniref:Peptidoglycan-binding protein n=1 Tax=Streptomyces cylindrosporus TaxID=2927583 RepID=A0ABS9YGY4_9ACTN|nr:peptidoglycan-binding protein [Streptomyces cylindrosporus]MCI3276512.1 peptidoglycan-binding protein [Streptomyces cylindrosporus]